MRWIDLFLMSGGNLKRRKLRTFLTVLGVVIGTASVIAMLSLGLGLQKTMYQDIEDYGSLTTLSVTGAGGGYGDFSETSKDTDPLYLTDETVADFASFDHVLDSTPAYRTDVMLIKGKYESGASLIGLTPEGFQALKLDLEWGELPRPDSGVLDLVFGNRVAAEFYDPKAGSSPFYDSGEIVVDVKRDSMFMILDTQSYYGARDAELETGSSTDSPQQGEDKTEEQPIQIKAKKYSVKAIGLISGGTDSWNMNSNAIFCDLDALRTVLKKEFKGRPLPGQPTLASGKAMKDFVYSYAQVKVDNIENVEGLAQTFRNLGYQVESPAEWIKQMEEQLAIIQLVLGGIGAVSLLVAAIGIANTMIMAIYERTREIGVMKVIGCSLKNIRQMFLIESACIGLIGGVLGNLLGFGISGIVNFVTKGMLGEEVSASSGISYIPPWLVLAALGIATSVGIASGFFPALRAMRLSPLAAIRNE
jgi:ABC-type antimicrobial peptide transport system permease subunit